ncbi:Dihydropteroate synthase-like protein [Cladorrhinum sp. PSN332]|nr:Dihydropteroate synthase-like protein [Cladorrhinum sp. PSN332]
MSLQSMRHFAIVSRCPLTKRTPQKIFRLNIRYFSSSSSSSSSTTRNSPLATFKSYTFPRNFEVKELQLPAKMSDDKKVPEAPRKRLAYIALGSNLGDRIGWIEKACAEMDKRGIRVKRTSSLWETEPMYVLEQDRFVNGACEVETTLEPLELLDALQDIENSLGRKKIIDKGPRNIDLDILLYDNIKFDHERLTIPHIGIPEREFVLKPLTELIPSHPVNPNKPWTLTRDLLDALPLSPSPITTMTPLSSNHPPIQALNPARKTHVMGILNMTPDSFSDGGSNDPNSTFTLQQTIEQFLSSGASMIDIGGQSTAPGAPEVSVEEELSRVLPAIKLIRERFTEKPVLISVDTYRAVVAEAAVGAGADIVNDVSGGSMDPEMLSTVARLGSTICLMHMRGTPATMNSLAEYPGGLIPGIAKELVARVEAAEAAGIRRWRIVLDPGLGFAKIGKQNVDVLRHLEELRMWPGLQGLPWLVGSSRKSFIGRVTGVPTPKERIWGTAATVAAAVQGGADVVRVHDVKEMAQVVAMADAIWRY